MAMYYQERRMRKCSVLDSCPVDVGLSENRTGRKVNND